jgi:hypothetical protein
MTTEYILLKLNISEISIPTRDKLQVSTVCHSIILVMND